MTDDKMMVVGPDTYREFVRTWYRGGKIDLYEAMRLMFNAGFRGRELSDGFNG